MIESPLAVLRLSGAMATASSLTVPRSKTSSAPAESALPLAWWKTQNSRNSFLREIHPGAAERGHHRAPARAVGPRRAASSRVCDCAGPALRRCRGGAPCRARFQADPDCRRPGCRSSMSRARSSTDCPVPSAIRFCQVSCTASAVSKAGRRSSAPRRRSAARLPNCQRVSRKRELDARIALELLQVGLARSGSGPAGSGPARR